MTPGLIERLEAAGEGSRELDALLWLRFNRPHYQGGVEALEMRTWYDGRGHLILETDAGEEVADTLGISPVTTSLDAALALAERVLPGWLWQVTTITTAIGGIRKPFAVVMNPDDDNDDIRTFGEATTPALALCIAILKARATQEQTHG